MSDETGLERAEQNFRALVRCRSNGGGLEDFLAEYDRRGSERDEALGLLRELVKMDAHWDDVGRYSDDFAADWRAAWGRARALVERAGPAGAHPAESGDSS